MPRLRRALLAATALTSLTLLAPPQPLRAEDAGIAGAVNTDVLGTPPGGAASNLEVGRTVVRNEHIVSNEQGLAQLLFLDQTTLTVGPNSDIVIDEFVYDPATKDGHLLMEASVGVFRLIGGETATSGGITVGTPFATMGIRGSNIIIEISPNGRTRITCNYCEAVEIQLLNDPDNLVTIFGSDRFRTIEIGPEGFSAPFELTREEVAQLQDLLTSRPGQNGGIAQIPSEPQVSQNVTGQNNSGNPPGQNAPGAPSEVEQGYNDQVIPNPQEQTEAGQNQNEDDATQGGQAPPLHFSGGSFISTGGTVTLLADGNDGWSGDLEDPEHTQPIDSAQVVGDRLVVQLADGRTFSLPYRAGTVTVAGDGRDPQGGALVGEGFVDPNGDFFYYQLFAEAGGRATLLFGGQALPDFESFQQFMAWDLQPDAQTGGPAPFLPAGFAGDLQAGQVVTSPLYYVGPQGGGSHEGRYGTASLGFSGSGAGQSSLLSVSILEGNAPGEGDPRAALDGATRAFSSTPAGFPSGDNGHDTGLVNGDLGSIADGNGDAFFGSAEGAYFVIGSGKWRSGSNSDVLYHYGTADGGESYQAYEPVHLAKPGALPAGVGQDRPQLDRSGYAAGAADLGNGQGYVGLVGNARIYYSESTGGNMFLESVGTGNSHPTFSNVYLGYGNMLYVDRARIMMQESEAVFDYTYDGATVNAGLVSYDLVRQPGDLLPGGATACDCAFMEWGFWAYEADRGGYYAAVPIGTWVTGEQTFDYDDLPETATATYEGHAIANILNTTDGVTASYVASGALSMAVDFGSRDVNGAISNLDGRDYSFAADYTGWDGELALYQASGSATDNSVDIVLNGGFFAGPQSPVQGVGGNFTLTPGDHSGLDYVGTGTFMGEQVPQ